MANGIGKCLVDKNGPKWRVREITSTPSGDSTETFYYPSETEARHHKALFEQEAGDRTLGQAVTDHLEHLMTFGGTRGRALTGSGMSIRESKLVNVLRLVDRKAGELQRGSNQYERVYLDRPLKTLTPKEAQRLYTQATHEVAVATHHGWLAAAKQFGGWLESQGLLSENPFAGVRSMGTPNKGKDRLKLDHARRFLLVAYAHEGNAYLKGITCAAMITLGTRSHELLERTIDDLDDNGRVLMVPKSKTAAGIRRIQLPPVLRAHFRELVKRAVAAGSKWLFPSVSKAGVHVTNNTLLDWVRETCTEAKVPVVCAHGLRDTWVDLSVSFMTHLEKVAKGAGHADTKVTRDHYMSPGSETSVRAQLVEDMLLSDGNEGEETDEQVAERELAEASARLAALKAKRAENAAGQVALPAGSSTGKPILRRLKAV